MNAGVVRHCLAVLCAWTSVALYGAGADNVGIRFSTTPTDRYADGAAVLDGERYAVVWTEKGFSFGGFSAECQVLSSHDKLIRVKAVARDGCCPSGAFELQYAQSTYTKQGLGGGYFALYLLDTRISSGKCLTTAKATDMPPSINGYRLAVQAGELQMVPCNDFSASAPLADSAAWQVVGKPVITGIGVTDGEVRLSVSNAFGAAVYGVRSGDTPDRLSAVVPNVTREADGLGLRFAKPTGDGPRFFKVVGGRE